MGFVEREGLNLIFHETINKNHITPNFPNHSDIALDVFSMVENIDALYEEFKTRGAQIHYELKTNEYNMREFAIIDPQGYTIGFGE
ncbi:VOC family protein [Cohnella candidum]|uniref:VOC family protein n=1 Tax=Cohnella candidum TaxID=2674991 RepID=UPI0013DDAAC0|nr:VOC family protein [Cohnella candidum]